MNQLEQQQEINRRIDQGDIVGARLVTLEARIAKLESQFKEFDDDYTWETDGYDPRSLAARLEAVENFATKLHKDQQYPKRGVKHFSDQTFFDLDAFYSQTAPLYGFTNKVPTWLEADLKDHGIWLDALNKKVYYPK
jgi:hypothetical protein